MPANNKVSSMSAFLGKNLFLVLASIGVLGGTGGAWADDVKVFRAGAAVVDITPPLGELIVGGFVPYPSTHVHDPLHARCVMLDDGITRIGFVVCDNVGIPRDVFDAARKFIDDETDVPAQNILMSATHTHSATTARGDSKVAPEKELTWYQQFLARRIADAVRCALHNLEPAKIGWGGVDEPSELFNRRWFTTDPEQLRNPFGGVDQVRMNPSAGSMALVKPAGPTDPEVSFVSIRSKEGRPIALLGNYSLHYVGGVPGGDISADYFAIFATRIGELIGADQDRSSPPFVGILTNGTSGDVNNINFRERGPAAKPYEKMTSVAEKVALKVAEAEKSIEYRDQVSLGAATRELVLKVRKPDAQIQEYFAKLMAQTADAPKYHAQERVYAERMQHLLDSPDEVSVLIQGLKIGDLGIAAIPFEVFTEIGLEIKDKSPFADAFTIELANGSYGYLPTPAQHKLGGYETWLGTNNVELDASDKITATVLEILSELHGPGNR